ncbi:hypothetical protein CC86DRAFT_403713 [Ophiobolus disseminans]|uniref:Uncharacterized protein n=1 Tax=Ophiobolus disseminans TaxID=1469910 RepID=A0A6A7A709_9PLEO|nr:hypothetical protein CC86DRAFT_403713 [Ophiobolus disseminans]
MRNDRTSTLPGQDTPAPPRKPQALSFGPISTVQIDPVAPLVSHPIANKPIATATTAQISGNGGTSSDTTVLRSNSSTPLSDGAARSYHTWKAAVESAHLQDTPNTSPISPRNNTKATPTLTYAAALIGDAKTAAQNIKPSTMTTLVPAVPLIKFAPRSDATKEIVKVSQPPASRIRDAPSAKERMANFLDRTFPGPPLEPAQNKMFEEWLKSNGISLAKP